MDEHHQIFIPDSFLALYAVRGQKPSATRATVERRYELCEDLATLLVEHCSSMLHRDGLSEDIVLERCLRGLLVAPSSVQANEAGWVVRRTAELLQWPWHTPGATEGE
jgi:hypothetical protein